MAAPETLSDAALAAFIVERFHEAHRRDLPRVIELAGRVVDHDASPALRVRLRRMAADLEAHMFKEEMRLFPMIEQGGGPLLGHLIDDMVGEHRQHEEAVAEVRGLLAAAAAAPGAEAGMASLRSAIEALFTDLAEHVRLEDEVLFARFAAVPRAPIVG
jgi:regulator of cell morphogenesis and NO signaling